MDDKVELTREDVVEELDGSRKQGHWPSFRYCQMVALDLRGLDLSRCVLSEADLSNSDLRDCDLTKTDLSTAASIQGVLGIVAINNIGSRNDTLFCWRWKGGTGEYQYFFRTGCFEGNEQQFRKAIKQSRKEDGEGYEPYAKCYLAAIPLVKKVLDAHYEMDWEELV